MVNIRAYKEEDYDQVKVILKEANLFDAVWDSEVNLQHMIKDD